MLPKRHMHGIDALIAPASLAQRRLWTLDRLHPSRACFNISFAYRLCGALDLAALQRSLDAIVQAHATLRTALRCEGGDVVQVVVPKVAVPVSVVELSEPVLAERFQAALAAAVRQAAEPFDLETAPLLRASLYRLSDEESLLSLCFHHAIFDGWSERVFLRELSRRYTADVLGSAPDLDSHQSFLDDHLTALQPEPTAIPKNASVGDRQTRYSDSPSTLNLPFDRPRPVTLRRRGGLERISVSGELVAALARFSTGQHVTLYLTLLAAYAIVLHRYSGDDEFAIGAVLEGRSGREIEDQIGCFVDTVGIGFDLRGTPSFLTTLQRIRKAVSASYARRDALGDAGVEPPDVDPLATDIESFQTMFALQPSAGNIPPFGDLRVMRIDIHNGTAKCDLFLNVVPESAHGDLSCELEFDADLFDEQTAARLLASYRLLLESVVALAERPIAVLPLVSERERRLMTEWGRRPADYPRQSSIHREFETIAARTPSAVALSMGLERLTYAELDAQANQLAHRLRCQEVRRGEIVGVCLDRSPLAIVAQLAILKAGAAYLPLDPSYPSSRLEFMLEDAGVGLVLVKDSQSNVLPKTTARICFLDQEAAAIESAPAESVVTEVGPEDLAYVMYTSGSTGTPNGVRIPHRGVLRLVLGTDYIDWRRATTWLQMSSLSFDASTFEVWGPLLHGARLVVFPDRVPTIPALGRVLSEERVDCLWLTAAFFNVVVDEQPECLANVSQLIIGGEALSVPHVLRAQERVPTVDLINGYGPTECTTFACCYSIPRLSPAHHGSIPIGRPIGNTTVYVWDRRKQHVPIGVAGELFIGGDGVALGYLARPELTSERFVRDPLSPGRHLYRTGDVVRWRPDGVIEFLGRRDEQLKLRGFRVEPGEIEAACRRHPAVRDAVVLLVRGQNGPERLVAFVATGPACSLLSTELLEFLRLNLPAHLVPASAVVLESLPLTPNGKVDRNALLMLDREPWGDVDARPDRPRTATEESLAQIWKDLLRVDHVGVHDDFFAIGGHSLLAVRMFSRLHSVYGKSLPFSTLLQHPTVAQLARLLEPAPLPASSRSSLVPLKAGGHRPPIFLVHGIGTEVFTFLDLVKELPEDQPVFGVLPPADAASRASSIKEMASAYLTDIEAVVQNGPFVLAGHCSGAVTAFEMARQRWTHGQTVPLLLVFDYWFDEEATSVVGFTRNLVNWIYDDFLHTSAKNNIGRIRSRMRLLRGRVQRRVTDDAPPDDVRDVLGLWRYPDHEVERLRQFSAATAAYRFLPHYGPVHVFRARTRRLRTHQPSADMGWGEFARGALRVETVPGSHDSMFTHPFVRTLARRVEDAIEAQFSEARGAEGDRGRNVS